MRHSLRLMALALTVATATLLAPLAHAQGTPPPDGFPPEVPSEPQPLFQPPTGSSYLYYDNDGWGKLDVTYPEKGYGTGLQLIKCKLQQNGHTLYGSGVSYNGYLIYTISNYVFQCKPTGWGSYHPAGSPGNQKWFYLKQ